MPKITLSDLISAQILNAEEAEERAEESVAVETEERGEATAVVPENVEKIASALEFVGRKGIDSFLSKTATAASAPPPGTNIAAMKKGKEQKQVGPNKDSPPMKESAAGPTETNDKKKPGLPASSDGVDTTGKEVGDHHKGLSSNEAAIAVKKSDKAKLVAPSLDAVLRNKAYSDPKAEENLSNASSAGERNFRKAASDKNEVELIRTELARRAATANNQARE